MNRSLNRLITKHLCGMEAVPKVSAFINDVNDYFKQEEEAKLFMEKSIKLSSDELNQINSSLKDDKTKLKRIIAQQEALFHASPEAIFSFTNENIIDRMNQAGLDFLSLNREVENDEVLTCELFMARIFDREKFSREIQPIRDNVESIISGKFQTIDGKTIQYYSVPEMCEGERIGRVWCCRDVSQTERHQQLLKFQANHDPLTGLPNRMMLLDSLSDAIFSAKENKDNVAVLFIDLDDFKKINDTAGHGEGDKYLVEFTSRLNESLRVTDIYGRLGGDEFLVILESIKNHSDIIKVTNKILDICKVPFYIKDKQYHMSCSIGISTSPKDSINPDELIRKADMAMYQAKKLGKNQWQFFNSTMEEGALKRVLIENDLRVAIENKDFVLHYQPKINLETNSICGVEALIRWNRDGNQLIYPDQFISVAEDTGLIREITYWLVNEACSTLKKWENTVLSDVSISLNISAIDFADSKFIENVFNIIELSKISSSLLEFELTESVLFDDIASAKENIRKLKSKDIKISIDDFGTGFSSFSYLLDMEIDFLKIDKSFVMSANKDIKAKAIVKSIIDIGINLGLKVIGEGVESNNEMDFLKEEGCHIGQGYFMSRPVPEPMLLEYAEQLKNNN